MKRVTLIATAFVFAVLAVLSTRVAAQDTNTQERTFLTFSAPVELPGVTLPAGTYVFRLADTPTRNVVQVLSGDEKDMKGQWTFVQAERPQVTGDTVIMFKEAREGAAPAVQYWYYPGERIGKEFIYPKDQAMKIAARTGQSVLSDDGRVTSQVSSTDSQGNVTQWRREGAANPNSAPAPQAQVADAHEAPVVAPNSDAAKQADSTLRNAPAPAQPTAAAGSLAGNRGAVTQPDNSAANTARPVGTSGAADAQATDRPAQPESTQARASELPQTASPVPLSGLIGLLALAGALGSRKLAVIRR